MPSQAETLPPPAAPRLRRGRVDFVAFCLVLWITLWLADTWLDLQLAWISWAAILVFAALTIHVWLRLDKGMHPLFLFLATFGIFQMGHHVYFTLIDPEFAIDRIVLMGWNRWIDPAIIKQTSLLQILSVLTLSAVVLAGSRTAERRGRWAEEANSAARQFYLYAFVLLLPFMIAKNLYYLSHFLDQGYLSLYTGGGEHLAPVYLRLAYVFGYAAFFAYFIVERNPVRLGLWALVFLGMETPILLSGLRGRFFSELLVVLYLYKRARQKHFTLRELLLYGLAIAAIAIFVADFREGRTWQQGDELEVISTFLTSQGVSMQVLAMAIDLEELFKAHALHYLLTPVWLWLEPFNSHIDGIALANDLSMYLNLQAYDLGFGTGSSYLAEAYLLGGTVGIVLCSGLLGLVLMQAQNPRHYRWQVVSVYVLLSLIYLPRSPFTDFVFSPLKLILPFLVLEQLRIRLKPRGARR